MAEKKLTLVIEAKNRTDGELNKAGGAMSRFAKTAGDATAPLRKLWAAVYGPIGLVIAATLLFQRVMKGLTSILTGTGTAMRKLEADKAARDFTAWGKAVSGLSRMFQGLTRDLKNWREGTKAQQEAVGDLAKAERENAKAIAMAAAGTDEDRAEIEKQFQLEEKRIEALGKIEAAKKQILQSDQDAVAAGKLLDANNRKSLEVINQRTAAEERLADISARVAKEKKLGTVARGGSDYLKQLEAEETAAKQSLESIADAEEKLFEESDALQSEQMKRTKERAALETTLAKAELENKTLLINQTAEAELEAVRKVQQANAEKEEAIKAEKEKLAEIDAQIADEAAERERQNQEALIAQARERLDMAEKIAAAGIAGIIAEARAGKERAKAEKDDAARMARLQDKQRRGVKLSKRDQEFFDAAGLMEAAQGAVKGDVREIKEAEAKLQTIALEKQQVALDKLVAQGDKTRLQILALENQLTNRKQHLEQGDKTKLQTLALENQQAALDKLVEQGYKTRPQTLALEKQQAALYKLVEQGDKTSAMLRELLAQG
jgi:hypothetical protein